MGTVSFFLVCILGLVAYQWFRRIEANQNDMLDNLNRLITYMNQEFRKQKELIGKNRTEETERYDQMYHSLVHIIEKVDPEYLAKTPDGKCSVLPAPPRRPARKKKVRKSNPSSSTGV